MKLHNKKILITGGAGFIGSHLVDAMIAQGAHVTVLDNLSTGNLENIAQWLNDITFIHADITNYDVCVSATKGQDIVFHLAALVSVVESVEQPLACNAINVLGTINLLQACTINKIDRFIFSSSAAVYGNHEGICSEELVCTPTSPYGLSKLIGEQYCRLYTQSYSLKTICLRYFNVFGPRQNPLAPHAGFVSRVRYNMAHNLPITIYGDGQQTRDFVPVTAIVKANSAVATIDEQYLDGHALNVGSGKSISLRSMIEHIRQQEFSHYQQPLTFAPARRGDIKHSQADCRKLHELTIL